VIYLPHFDTGVPLFIMLHFIASQILFVVVGGGGGVFFNKLKFCVNLVLNKSMGTIFPGAFGHFVSLCYILQGQFNIHRSTNVIHHINQLKKGKVKTICPN